MQRDSGGATGGSAKGHGSRKLRAAKSPRFGKRSHLSEAEGGDGKDADGAAVEDGRASAGMGDLTSSRKHKRGRKPKKGCVCACGRGCVSGASMTSSSSVHGIDGALLDPLSTEVGLRCWKELTV